MSGSKAARANARPGKPQEHSAEPASPWEWAVAALGAILLAGAIGYMAYFAIGKNSEPPAIVITQRAITPSGSGYLVLVDIANRGNSTAASLTIAGELKRGGSTIETRRVTLDYLPRHSERRTGLFFTKDPNRFQLELYPVGYTEP
jgi:uncharacterized protein (TIGR02588 family)